MAETGFDERAFLKAQYLPRTANVQVPELKEYFGEAEAVWTVRGMTGEELARTAELAARNKSLDTAVQALSSKQAEIDQMREVLGVGDDVPIELAKRIEQLLVCSVDPVPNRQAALKLATTLPILFYQITNEIVRLTGLGMDLKKSEPSGEIPASAT